MPALFPGIDYAKEPVSPLGPDWVERVEQLLCEKGLRRRRLLDEAPTPIPRAAPSPLGRSRQHVLPQREP
jgi:hypothetical protein